MLDKFQFSEGCIFRDSIYSIKARAFFFLPLRVGAAKRISVLQAYIKETQRKTKV